jgi:hypothetical protein
MYWMASIISSSLIWSNGMPIIGKAKYQFLCRNRSIFYNSKFIWYHLIFKKLIIITLNACNIYLLLYKHIKMKKLRPKDNHHDWNTLIILMDVQREGNRWVAFIYTSVEVLSWSKIWTKFNLLILFIDLQFTLPPS